MPSSQGGQGGAVGADLLLHLADEVARLTQRVEWLEQRDQPISPLYSLDQAATLLPCLKVTLASLLQRHRALLDPPMYRQDSRHRRYRMLSHRDLLTLRARLIRRGLKRHRSQALRDLAA